MKARRFVINVTREAIDKAKPSNAGHCILAEAIRYSLPGATSIRVNDTNIRLNIDGWRHTYPTPARQALLAREFDEPRSEEDLMKYKASITPYSFQFSSNGTTAPVILRGPLLAARKKRPRRVSDTSVRRCITRYRGVQVLKVSNESQQL